MAFLSDKNIGDVVKIMENGTAVNYIIVHKGLPSDMYDSSCDGVWLLREQAHSKMAWEADNKSDYENSDIKAWLNGTFLNTIDEKIRAAIKTVKIPFKKGCGNGPTPVQSGSNGLSCKVFLLSGYEVGFTTTDEEHFPVDGAKLSYFLKGGYKDSEDSGAKTKRICKDSSDRAVHWWLRSPSTYQNFNTWYVYLGGSGAWVSASNTNVGARPAFILPSNLMVDANGNVSTNTLPTITSETASGSDSGEISAPFNFTYTANDADGDTVTVKEYLDNALQRSYTATLGAENTFEAVSDTVQFQKILNGQHTLKIIANDTKDDSEPYIITFNKQVRTAIISLKNPLPADDVIKAAVLSVTGNLPEDSTLEVLVTNNALDSEPVWEDMTRSVKNGTNHVFTNQAAANGFAFNFKVTVTRGVSEEEGYISNIGGAFE